MTPETVVAIAATVLLGVSETLPFLTSVRSNGLLEAIGIFCTTCVRKWNAAGQVAMVRIVCKDVGVQATVTPDSMV